jgi:hypothetical protein
MDKGGLVPWAIKFTLDTVRTEAGIERGVVEGTITKESVNAALDKASTAVDRHKKTAADFGTRAHDAINDIIMTGNMDIPIKEEDKDIAVVVEGFKRWYKQSGITLHPAGDTVVYSRKYGYAGAADAIGYRKEDGALLVVDFKTSNSVHSSYALQLAAYTNAIKEMLENGEMRAFDGFAATTATTGIEAGKPQTEAVATSTKSGEKAAVKAPARKQSSRTTLKATTFTLDNGNDGITFSGGLASGSGLSSLGTSSGSLLSSSAASFGGLDVSGGLGLGSVDSFPPPPTTTTTLPQAAVASAPSSNPSLEVGGLAVEQPQPMWLRLPQPRHQARNQWLWQQPSRQSPLLRNVRQAAAKHPHLLPPRAVRTSPRLRGVTP